MNKIILTSALVLLGFIQASVFGRIGETKAQCDARYGQPEEIRDDGTVKYIKTPFLVLVKFNDRGVADNIQFTSFEPMLDEQVISVVKNNFMGKAPFPNGANQWRTADNSIAAVYLDEQGYNLIVMTADYQKRLNQAKNKELDGF